MSCLDHENWLALKQEITDFSRRANRPDIPALLAVSKGQSADKIRALLNHGHRWFGENRVQEAQEKWLILKAEFPDARLHLIGHLQTNKVREAVALFDVIETIDSLKLATKIAEVLKQSPKKIQLLIQINIGDEPQKSGVTVNQLPELLRHCQNLNLPIVGLMCIPPVQLDPAPFFKRMQKLAKEYGLSILSMGMSHDFHEAIACGTSWVRIGTALFGAQ